MQVLEEGAWRCNAVRKRPQHSPSLAKDKMNFIMVFLQCFKKKPQTHKKLWPVSYSISFVFPMLGSAGRVAEGVQQAPTVPWSGLGYGECCMAQVRQIFSFFGIKMLMF